MRKKVNQALRTRWWEHKVIFKEADRGSKR